MAKNVLENCLSVWCNFLPKYLEVFDGKKKRKKYSNFDFYHKFSKRVLPNQAVNEDRRVEGNQI